MKPRPRHSKCGRSSNTSASNASARGLPSSRTTRVYWFSTSHRPSRIWVQQHGDRLEDVERLEPGGDERLAVLRGDEAVRPLADHGRHVAWAEEAVEAEVGRLEDRLDRRHDRDVVGEDA